MHGLFLSPRCVAPTGCKHGQGGVWSPSEGFLWWVDRPRAKLHRHNPITGNTRRYDLPLKASVLALCDGALLMAGEREVGLYDPSTEEYSRWVVLDDEPTNTRINAGGVSSDGAFWFATMDESGREARANYYRMGSNRKPVQIQMPSITEPTGMDFSPDGLKLTTCDTTEHEILQYDLDANGEAVPKRRSVAFTFDEGGRPHDVAIDVEGGIWTCISGGSRIVRYLPNGQIDQVVAVSAPRPTACVFGGDDMRTLFIITSRDDMSFTALDARPLSGSLFTLNVNVPGVRQRDYIAKEMPQ